MSPFAKLGLGQIAGVVEWQTRTTQNRVPQGMRVRLPPPAFQKNSVNVHQLAIPSAGNKHKNKENDRDDGS